MKIVILCVVSLFSSLLYAGGLGKNLPSFGSHYQTVQTSSKTVATFEHRYPSGIDEQTLDKLLSDGLNISRKMAFSKRGPLHANTLLCAIDWDQFVVVDKLINAGIDVNAGDIEGVRPIHWLIYRGWSGWVRNLIERGAYVNSQDNSGKSALHYLIQSRIDTIRKIELLNLFHEHKVEINLADKAGSTALHYAKNDPSIIEALLKLEADYSIMNNKGEIPFALACPAGREIMKKSSQANTLMPYLISALENNDFEKIDVIKQDIAPIIKNFKDAKGNTLLHYAINKKDLKTMRYILSINPELIAEFLDTPNDAGITPLELSIQDTALFAYLMRLTDGEAAYEKIEERQSVGHGVIIKYLLEKGKDLEPLQDTNAQQKEATAHPANGQASTNSCCTIL